MDIKSKITWLISLISYLRWENNFMANILICLREFNSAAWDIEHIFSPFHWFQVEIETEKWNL